MLLIQYGCNKTYVLLTLIIDFDFVHMATLSLQLSLYQEREREREREIVETITGAGDDLLFFKIMQICSFLKYSNKIKGTACSSLTRKSNTNYNGC